MNAGTGISGHGTELTFLDVRCLVAVGSEADATLIAGTHNQRLGTAHLDVAFANVLRGTRIAARGDGLFKNVRLAQTQAMNTTGGHGTNRAMFITSKVG